MKNIGILLLILVGCIQLSEAQDVRFSQYYAAPLYINPALSGAYDGSYKLTAIYRDQWRGTFNEPISTAGFSADARFKMGKRGREDAASGGIMFLSDRTSLYDFNTTFIGLTGAFHKSLNDDTRSYLSAGFRFSMINKGVNYENLTFQDMFNGVSEFSFPTTENLPINTLSFADLSIGINYSTKPSARSLFSIGASVGHILNNNISFYKNEEISPGEKKFIQDVRIKKLYHVDVQYTFPASRYLQLSPRISWRMQGDFMDLSIGTASHLRFREDARFAMHFGLWGRGVNYLDTYHFSTITGMVGFEYNSVIFGFSYDANIPDYINYGKGRNTFELSISYIGNYTNNVIVCPTL